MWSSKAKRPDFRSKSLLRRANVNGMDHELTWIDFNTGALHLPECLQCTIMVLYLPSIIQWCFILHSAIHLIRLVDLVAHKDLWCYRLSKCITIAVGLIPLLSEMMHICKILSGPMWSTIISTAWTPAYHLPNIGTLPLQIHYLCTIRIWITTTLHMQGTRNYIQMRGRKASPWRANFIGGGWSGSLDKGEKFQTL